jgi:hypothetical protein
LSCIVSNDFFNVTSKTHRRRENHFNLFNIIQNVNNTKLNKNHSNWYLGSFSFNFFLLVIKHNVHFILLSDDVNFDGLTTGMLHCIKLHKNFKHFRHLR